MEGIDFFFDEAEGGCPGLGFGGVHFTIPFLEFVKDDVFSLVFDVSIGLVAIYLLKMFWFEHAKVEEFEDETISKCGTEGLDHVEGEGGSTSGGNVEEAD